jgi:hypothetical protein
MATSISEIQAVAWEYRDKKTSDLVTDNIPLTYMLKKKGRVEVINGGRVIWEDTMFQQNNYVQRIDPTEEIAIGYNQTLTAFEYSAKIIVVPVVINAYERAQNEGDAQFLDLLAQRNKVAEASLGNALEEDLQGDGSGYGGKAFAGIQSYIVTSPTLGSYGGVSRVDYTSIRNAAVDAPSTFTGATDSSNIESRLRYSKNLVVRNGGPELCLAGQTYYNAACDALSAKQRFTQNKEMLEANFDNIVIEGMTMVLANGKVFSGLTRIAADRCYGIRLDNYSLKMYKNYNFQPVQDRVSVNQLVDIGITVGIGQFTCNGSSLSFVMYDS